MASSRLECSIASRCPAPADRKSTRLNSSHVEISYAVFCLKKKKHNDEDGEWVDTMDGGSRPSVFVGVLSTAGSRHAHQRADGPEGVGVYADTRVASAIGVR